MEPYQEKAWNCLTEPEQNSLFLNISKGLSTKKTGEIMKLSHYKYLELKARAETLFKLFSEYFQVYPDLVRPRCILDEPFRYYLEACLIKRLPKSEAKEYAGDELWLLNPITNRCIVNNMRKLKQSEDPWDQDLYALIQEFDRWNNFRILPLELQTTSPYKRRETKKYIIYFNYIKTIPQEKWDYLLYKYCSKGKDELRYYVSLFSDNYEDGYLIIPIKRDQEILEYFNNLRLYVFDKYSMAQEFALMIVNYKNKSVSQKSGLLFWKRFKELIPEAINYKQVDNHDFNFNFLDRIYGISRTKSRKK